MIPLFSFSFRQMTLSSSSAKNSFLLNGTKRDIEFWLSLIKSPGEALSTFSRASRDPKGETQLQVVKSTKMGNLTPKTKPKYFPNRSKTTLKKSRNRLFWPPKWSKMTPQIDKNEQIFDPTFQSSRLFINLWSLMYTQK